MQNKSTPARSASLVRARLKSLSLSERFFYNLINFFGGSVSSHSIRKSDGFVLLSPISAALVCCVLCMSTTRFIALSL